MAKAALECSVRYLAVDLGKDKIKINAISAGPIKTLAASAVSGLKEKLSLAKERAPLQENVGYLCIYEYRGWWAAVLHL